MAGPTDSHWTAHELEVAVVVYLDMLQAELAGATFAKAERNRVLQGSIGRSRGSIEYRHQNISWVMVELGLPFIQGYKPASHCPVLLYEIVKAQLVNRGLHDCLAGTNSMITIPNGGLVYESAPVTSDKPKTDNLVVRQIRREFDPAARAARNRSLGEAGEKLVLQAEQERLSSNGRADLAVKVRWVAKDEGDGAGFDILSFTKRGEVRWLEVKTTNGPATTPFWISENERCVSEKYQDIFRLVRLYNFSRKPAAYRLKPPLADHVHLAPRQYQASF